MNEYGLLIDGVWRPAEGGRTLDVVNPATGVRQATAAHASADDLDDALAAAESGGRAWRSMTAWERSAVLRRASVLLAERADEVARRITQEQGKPLREAASEVAQAVEQLDWCADEARRIYGRVVDSSSASTRYRVQHEPIGPVAAFTPWNFPISLAARKIAPALAAGCSIIIKPAEEAPGATIAMAECLMEAGLPAGALGVVTGDPAQISEHLITSPVIRKVSLTGSAPVGRRLIELSAVNIAAVSMELGGHAPVLVFADADPERAARLCVQGKFRNSGQVCVSPTRFYVHESIAEAFTAEFVRLTAGLRSGDGLNDDTDIGPLANERRRQAVHAVVEDARARGAKILEGGEIVDGPGYFYRPAVIVDVPDDARVLREEPFGPIAPIGTFVEFEEAIAKANSTDFGLAAYVITNDLITATRASEQIEAGIVGVNTLAASHTPVPFGGVKQSGIGSENGLESVQAYLVTKTVITELTPL